MHLLIIHASILKLSTCETNSLMTHHIFYTADLQYIPQHLPATLWSFASTINRSASTSSLLASARTQFCQFGGLRRRDQTNKLPQLLQPASIVDREEICKLKASRNQTKSARGKHLQHRVRSRQSQVDGRQVVTFGMIYL